MEETWYDDKFKYVVELTERKEVREGDKVKEFVMKYKVLSQEERKPQQKELNNV